MREAMIFAAASLRRAMRGRGAIAAVVAVVGVPVLAAVWTRDAAGARTLALVALGVVAFLAVAVASATGGWLPADRLEGREAWLRTLAPSGPVRRWGRAAAGIGLAASAALAAALLLGVVLPALGVAPGVRHVEDLPLPRDTLAGPRGEAPGQSLTLELPAAVGPQTLEIAFQPRYRAVRALGAVLRVGWKAGGEEGLAVLHYGEPLHLDLPAAGGAVELVAETPDVDLIARDARILGASGSFLVSALWAGLLLGLGAAALVPWVLLVSRWTSGPTAVATGYVLALVGLARPLVEALPPAPGGQDAVGLRVLQAVSALAPDLSRLAPAFGPASGHVVEPLGLAGLGALVLHAAVGFVLLALPDRWVQAPAGAA